MTDFRASVDAAELTRTLLRAADDLADLEAVNAVAGDRVLNAADIPRRSGSLAASSRAVASAGEVVIGSPLRYATFVHWGAPRRGIVARPFFTDALSITQESIIELYADHARAALTKVES